MGYSSLTHILPEHWPKKPASEGVFDRMEMSAQILKIREQGVTLLCSQFRF